MVELDFLVVSSFSSPHAQNFGDEVDCGPVWPVRISVLLASVCFFFLSHKCFKKTEGCLQANQYGTTYGTTTESTSIAVIADTAIFLDFWSP